MIIKAKEKGQALILITLAAIGLFAFAALAIDGSRAYSNKRHAQNAADTAALAGALAYVRGNDIEAAALVRASDNGYETNGTSTEVTVTIVDVPTADCPSDTVGKDITVTIDSYIYTTFARIIGRDTLDSGATATSRACGFYYKSLFDGNAVVGLSNTSPCGFDTGNSSSVKWKVKGGGIFSNGCAFSKESTTITFDPGRCVSSVDGASGSWNCTPQPAQEYDYSEYLSEIMPPNPCDGDPDDIGIWPSGSGANFSDGVYCISNFDDYDKKDITLNNATLYVVDDAFNLQFDGTGGFFGTPTHAGTYDGSDDYDGYYLVVEPADVCTKFSDNHHQAIEWRGNGTGSFYGTILAPSACIDLRGNGQADGLHSQVIGWIVGSNGTGDVYVNYAADENHQKPVFPSVTVLR